MRGDRNGADLLTPLLLGDGTAVLVDRGWIAETEIGEPTSAPGGPVVVRGVVRGSRTLDDEDDVERIGARVSMPRVDTARLGRVFREHFTRRTRTALHTGRRLPAYTKYHQAVTNGKSYQFLHKTHSLILLPFTLQSQPPARLP